MESNKLIFLSCLQEPEKDFQKVYRIGCVGFIMRMKILDDGCVKILIQGLERASIDRFENNVVHLSSFQTKDTETNLSEEDNASLNEIRGLFKTIV